MNLFKKTVCVVLMLTVVLGLTACASKLTHKNMVSFLEDQKYDDYDDPEDYFAIYGRIAGGMTRLITTKTDYISDSYSPLKMQKRPGNSTRSIQGNMQTTVSPARRTASPIL